MKKQNEDKVPDIEKEGWTSGELADEAVNEEPSDIVEKLRKEKSGAGEDETGGCCGA